MAYKLEVDHPDFPKGFEFDCDGILVENGETHTVTKEEELLFIGRWGHDIKHFYGHGTIAKVTGSSELSAKEKKDAMAEVSETPDQEELADMEASHDSKNGGE